MDDEEYLNDVRESYMADSMTVVFEQQRQAHFFTDQIRQTDDAPSGSLPWKRSQAAWVIAGPWKENQ
eukprot:5158973-Pyramimonas_sp.AAC.1